MLILALLLSCLFPRAHLLYNQQIQKQEFPKGENSTHCFMFLHTFLQLYDFMALSNLNSNHKIFVKNFGFAMPTHLVLD